MPFWGCVPVQKQPVPCTNPPLPQQGPAVSGLTQASWLDTTVPELQAGALCKCSEYPHPGFTRNCYSLLLPAVLASVPVCAMGVLCSCVQGHVKRPNQRRRTGSLLSEGLRGSGVVLGWADPSSADLQVSGGRALACPAELVRLSCPASC